MRMTRRARLRASRPPSGAGICLATREGPDLPVVPTAATAAGAAAIVAESATTWWPAAAAPTPLRARLIDHEVPVPEHPAVQLFHRTAGFLRRRHLHEAEAPGTAGELVGHDADRLHGPGLLEELPKVVLGGLVGQVAYEELRGHRSPPASDRDKKASGEASLFEGRWRTEGSSLKKSP